MRAPWDSLIELSNAERFKVRGSMGDEGHRLAELPQLDRGANCKWPEEPTREMFLEWFDCEFSAMI